MEVQKSKEHLSIQFLPKYKSLAEYISICLIFIYVILCFLHVIQIDCSTRIPTKYEGLLICNLVLNVCLLFGLKHSNWKILLLWLVGNIGEFIVYVGIVSSTIETSDWWTYFADSILLGLYVWAIWVILTVMQLIRLESKMKKTCDLFVVTSNKI